MRTITSLNRKRSRLRKFYEPEVYMGSLLIPDISGFTQFVRNTDLLTGKLITFRLLSAILRSNFLGLQVSEIEGDAILFYKYEQKFTVKEILDQYEVMLESFNEELELLSDELGEEINLNLKLIAHYGKLADYRIGKFQKLYGETVVEAHHLLKNNVDSSAYVLITDNLLEEGNIPNTKIYNRLGNRLCDKFRDIKHICYTFFDYQVKPLQQLIA